MRIDWTWEKGRPRQTDTDKKNVLQGLLMTCIHGVLFETLCHDCEKEYQRQHDSNATPVVGLPAVRNDL